MALLRRVGEEVGVDVPVADFFASPTLGDLLRAAGPRPADSRDVVVLLRPGSGRPVHLLVEGWRPLADHRALALQLDTGRPVYAVRPGAADGRPHPVEELAEQAGQAITAVQPDGPYTLLGHGLAGLVAHEVAGRLGSAGAVVDQVVLLDTPAPVTAVPGWRRAARRWTGRLAAVRSADRGQQLWQRFVDRFAPATTTPERQEMLHTRAAAADHRLSDLDGPVLLVCRPGSPPTWPSGGARSRGWWPPSCRPGRTCSPSRRSPSSPPGCRPWCADPPGDRGRRVAPEGSSAGGAQGGRLGDPRGDAQRHGARSQVLQDERPGTAGTRRPRW